MLRRALNIGVRWGYINRNPCELVALPSEDTPEIEPLMREQVHTFLEATSNGRLTALYRVAFTLGLRQGEILGLTWDRVDIDVACIWLDRQPQRYDAAYRVDRLKTARSRRTLGLCTRASGCPP